MKVNHDIRTLYNDIGTTWKKVPNAKQFAHKKRPENRP